tara:strand:+ start:12217 stop:12750 length:534 start_codon:yes stop_codon:yes gene_type:complete
MPSPSPSPSPSPTSTFFHLSTELADLGRARFDHDTAQATDRDASLFAGAPVTVRQGRAPKGLEDQVFAWNTFKYTTAERDDREELKGDLHEGQLHRQNRAAVAVAGGGGMVGGGMMGGGGSRGGGGGGGAARGRGGKSDGTMDALCAGRKPGGEMAPLAKGCAEELDKGMFWDGRIV